MRVTANPRPVRQPLRDTAEQLERERLLLPFQAVDRRCDGLNDAVQHPWARCFLSDALDVRRRDLDLLELALFHLHAADVEEDVEDRRLRAGAPPLRAPEDAIQDDALAGGDLS